MTIGLAIVGASGRMGKTLIEAALASDDCHLACALDRDSSPALGLDAGAPFGKITGVKIAPDIKLNVVGADTLIDFTRPEGTLAHLAACRELGISAVIGTTGFSEVQLAKIKDHAAVIPIVLAPNMSIGVNVTLKLLELAAQALKDYDIEISEIHHRHKVDAPSGTALKMGEVIARAQGKQLGDCAVYDRHGVVGERVAGTIGFACQRAGDITGDHAVLFAGVGERIEISHKASSRMIYAQGSLMAACYLKTRPPGLYDMFDVLGLK